MNINTVEIWYLHVLATAKDAYVLFPWYYTAAVVQLEFSNSTWFFLPVNQALVVAMTL